MTTSEILDGFKNLKALVVGDICLDRWCTYDPDTSEPSRETGIPRLVLFRHRSLRAGAVQWPIIWPPWEPGKWPSWESAATMVSDLSWFAL